MTAGALLRTARLDLRAVAPYGRAQIVVMALVVPLFASLAGEPATAQVIAAVFATFLASYPFAIADKFDLDTLYGMLPLSRRALVAGRFVFALGLFVAAALFGAVLAAAIAAARHETIGAGDEGLVLAISFAIFAAVVALQHPLFWALGYTKARAVSYVPLLALALGGALLPMLGFDPTGPSGAMPAYGALVAALVGGGVVALAASVVVSVRLDARRVR
jgi:hypothetical protein